MFFKKNCHILLAIDALRVPKVVHLLKVLCWKQTNFGALLGVELPLHDIHCFNNPSNNVSVGKNARPCSNLVQEIIGRILRGLPLRWGFYRQQRLFLWSPKGIHLKNTCKLPPMRNALNPSAHCV